MLSDPARLWLFSPIAQQDETCVCELVGPLGVSQPTVSCHLKVFYGAVLVERENRGVLGALSPVRESLSILSGLVSA